LNMSANKTLTKNLITMYDFDPDATTATAVGFVDMRDYSGLTVAYWKTVGTGALTSLIIQGSTASNGAAPVTVATKTIASDPDAVGDYVFFEIDEDDIAQAGAGLRYVSATIALGTSTDEAVVTYIRTGAKFAGDGETADVVA
jgi:hypothetical protein